MTLRRTLLRRATPIVMAAVVLLALIDVHTAIVRQALRLLGVGFAEPKVLMVSDGCGHERWLPPGLDALRPSREPLQSDCPQAGQALVLLPSAGDSIAFVNGSPVRPQMSGGRLAWFTGVRWRPGTNALTAWEANDALLYPVPMRSINDASASLIMGTLSRPAGGDIEPGLAMAIANEVPRLAIVSTAPSTATPGNVEPSASRELVPTSRRALEVQRAADGTLNVRAELCVAPAHPFARQAAAMSGPELLSEVFSALVVGEPRPAKDPIWHQMPRVTTDMAQGEAGCLRVRTEYSVPNGNLALIQQNDFLMKDGDKLVLSGFGDSLQLIGVPADQAGGDKLQWAGKENRPGGYLVVFSRGLTGQSAQLRRSSGGTAMPPVPTAGSASAPLAAAPPPGLLSSLRSLQELLPSAWSATAWALAAAAPVALMLWALRRGWPPQTRQPQRLQRAHAGLVALLAFMIAFAAQPLLLQLTSLLLGTVGLSRLAGVPFPVLTRGGDLSAPVALCAVMLVVPILRGAQSPAGGWRLRAGAAMAACVAVVLLVVALMVHTGVRMLPGAPGLVENMLGLLPPAWRPEVDAGHRSGALIFVLLGGWATVGLALFWTANYWLFRVAVPAAPVLGAAFIAGVLLFLLPMIQGIADLAWVAAGELARANAPSAYFVPVLMVGDPTLAVTTGFVGGFVVLVVMILLHALREVAAAMLNDTTAERLRRVVRKRWLFLAALVIVVPMANRSWAEPNMIHSVTYQLMSFFQAFGALLAVMVPLAAAQEQDALHRVAQGDDRFALPDALLVLLSAAFAGYLTLWNREPVAVALLIVVGWFAFRRGVIAPVQSVPVEPPSGLAKLLTKHVAESRLLKARRSALEKQFTEGTISLRRLTGQRERLDRSQQEQDQALGMLPDEARRRLFLHGPCNTPLGNGLRAAGAGIAVGLVLQLLLQFEWSSGAAKAKEPWFAILGKFIVDPQYRVMSTHVVESRLLTFCGELLNALALWAIAGFIFGYVFHRIRGRDGFVRAAVFGFAVSVPYLLSQGLVASGERVPTESLLRVVPLLIFLLAVGTLVFDGATLRRQGVSIAKLPDIYGLKTSVGYLSFAGALAGVQPLLDFLGWVSGK